MYGRQQHTECVRDAVIDLADGILLKQVVGEVCRSTSVNKGRFLRIAAWT